MHGRGARAAAACAAALRIALPNAHITAASAVPSNDSLRALGQKPYCRVEATVDAETHIRRDEATLSGRERGCIAG